MTLKDQVIVITGGTSGIGKATTKLLLKAGAKVVVGARNKEKLLQMEQEINQPANFLTLPTDVTDPKQVQQLVNLAIEKFKKIDVMYNNAGIMPLGNLANQTFETWKKVVDINILGVLNGIAAALPFMKEKNHGLIMSTDSVAGHVVYPGSAVYNATKFAVKTIMEGLRQEEHANGIKTAMISPGFVNTNLLSTINDPVLEANMKNLVKQNKDVALTPEDVAELNVFIMSQPQQVDVNEILVRPTKQDV